MTEAAYCIERGMDILAQKLGMEPAELRLKNFIRPEQFPYHSALGWDAIPAIITPRCAR